MAGGVAQHGAPLVRPVFRAAQDTGPGRLQGRDGGVDVVDLVGDGDTFRTALLSGCERDRHSAGVERGEAIAVAKAKLEAHCILVEAQCGIEVVDGVDHHSGLANFHGRAPCWT